MPPKERDTGSVGRSAPPKPAVEPVKADVVEEPAKVVETPKPVEEPAKVAPPVVEKTEKPEEKFYANTMIKSTGDDGQPRFLFEDDLVTGFSPEEMLAFYEVGTIRRG